MGIPFGETESERRELGELQISSGISGMRLVPNELEPNRALIDQLGRAGLWLFAINPFESTAATRFLLDWLERHPEGKIASPHFLRPQRLEERVTDVELFKTLLRHPRYHAIFSRQGGTGTSAPYPHPDLQPWVEQIAELVTWERIMWGSEFPIIYQRNEQPEMARDWLLNLGVKLNQQERVNFYANNARRLFFAEAAPPFEKVPLPPCVARQIDQTATVYLFPANQIFIPMQDHATLLNDYLNQTQIMPDLSFADYIAQVLSTYAADVRRQAGNS
jgi:hypothetical protein